MQSAKQASKAVNTAVICSRGCGCSCKGDAHGDNGLNSIVLALVTFLVIQQLAGGGGGGARSGAAAAAPGRGRSFSSAEVARQSGSHLKLWPSAVLRKRRLQVHFSLLAPFYRTVECHAYRAHHNFVSGKISVSPTTGQ